MSLDFASRRCLDSEQARAARSYVGFRLKLRHDAIREILDQLLHVNLQAGIVQRAPAPTFKEFAPRFEQAIETLCKDKPSTVAFYKERMRRLSDFAPLTTRTLDAIDEELIESLKRKRTRQVSRLGRALSVASINRELATLRRLLRLAQEWKVIDRVPKIRLFRGEENREFVLDHEQEELYLHMAPQPLKGVALLMLDTGVRPGEACALEWPHVHLTPASGSEWGYLHIAGGKSKKAKRNLMLTPRVSEMLKLRRRDAQGAFVFLNKAGAGSFPVSSLVHQHDEFSTLTRVGSAVRDTLIKAHNAHPSGRVGGGRLHHHENLRSFEHHCFSALRSPVAGVARKGVPADERFKPVTARRKHGFAFSVPAKVPTAISR